MNSLHLQTYTYLNSKSCMLWICDSPSLYVVYFT